MPNLDAVIAVSPNRMREGELTVAAADVRINAYSYPLSIVLSIDLGRQSSCDLIRSTSYDNRTPGLEDNIFTGECHLRNGPAVKKLDIYKATRTGTRCSSKKGRAGVEF